MMLMFIDAVANVLLLPMLFNLVVVVVMVALYFIAKCCQFAGVCGSCRHKEISRQLSSESGGAAYAEQQRGAMAITMTMTMTTATVSVCQKQIKCRGDKKA